MSGRHSLRIDENVIEFEDRETRNAVWRIGTCFYLRGIFSLISDSEFRLSAMLVGEYANVIDSSREFVEKKEYTSLEVRNRGEKIALGVQQKKQMYGLRWCCVNGRNIAFLSFLTDVVTSVLLIETARQRLVQQSRVDVIAINHYGLLDEV